MSYDYLLVKGTLGESLEGFVDNALFEPIGSVTEVKGLLSVIFPSTTWETSLELSDDTMMSAYFVKVKEAEFQLMVEDGQVHMISMSRCERSVVERVAGELGLVALDRLYPLNNGQYRSVGLMFTGFERKLFFHFVAMQDLTKTLHFNSYRLYN